ncbi:MAG: NAD(P)-dependent oxidoreductase [bacterium]|nr:NAD(P)-dependent oxidoreductase [bacterium]
MKKIVITGGEGFLGKYVTGLLGKKTGVTLSRFERGKHSFDDLPSMKNLLQDSSAVVHMAGLNRANDHEILRVNTLGTHGLLKAIALYSPGIRFVFASSTQAYDANSIYGLSKLFAEKLIESYAKKNLLEGVALRFSNLYGPGARPFYNSVIATFASQIRTGKPITIHGNGRTMRDFLYVTDAADIIQKSLSLPLKNRFLKIDVCSGRTETVRKVVSLMQQHVSRKIKVNYSPEESDNIGYSRNLKKNTAKEIFGWVPRVSFEEGITRMMDSI